MPGTSAPSGGGSQFTTLPEHCHRFRCIKWPTPRKGSVEHNSQRKTDHCAHPLLMPVPVPFLGHVLGRAMAVIGAVRSPLIRLSIFDTPKSITFEKKWISPSATGVHDKQVLGLNVPDAQYGGRVPLCNAPPACSATCRASVKLSGPCAQRYASKS